MRRFPIYKSILENICYLKTLIDTDSSFISLSPIIAIYGGIHRIAIEIRIISRDFFEVFSSFFELCSPL